MLIPPPAFSLQVLQGGSIKFECSGVGTDQDQGYTVYLVEKQGFVDCDIRSLENLRALVRKCTSPRAVYSVLWPLPGRCFDVGRSCVLASSKA